MLSTEQAQALCSVKLWQEKNYLSFVMSTSNWRMRVHQLTGWLIRNGTWKFSLGLSLSLSLSLSMPIYRCSFGSLSRFNATIITIIIMIYSKRLVKLICPLIHFHYFTPARKAINQSRNIEVTNFQLLNLLHVQLIAS